MERIILMQDEPSYLVYAKLLMSWVLLYIIIWLIYDFHQERIKEKKLLLQYRCKMNKLKFKHE